MAKSKRVEFKYADIALALQECSYQDGRQFVTDIYLRAGVPLEAAKWRAKSALDYIGAHNLRAMIELADMKRIAPYLPHISKPDEPKCGFNLDLSGLDLLLEMGVPKKDVKSLASNIVNHVKRQVYSTGISHIRGKKDDLHEQMEILEDAEKKLRKYKPANCKK